MRGSEVIRLSAFFDHILQAEEQTGKHIPELLAEVKKAGISAVEINCTYLLEHPATLEMLETAGLQVSCIYEFYALERGRETEKARRHIEIARKTKAGKILIVPGFFSVETEEFVNCVPDREKVWDYLSHSEKAQRMADGLREIVEMAGSRNIADTPITVVIEDFDDRNSPIACVSGMQWFAEQVPGLCFTFDTGNFIIHGENIFAAWEELKDKVVHVHCKDRKISSDKPLQTQKNATLDIKECYLPAAVGEGCIPIKELVYKMKEYGYRGYLAIEHFDAADQEAYMQKSAANLQEYCSQTGMGIYTK
ncbi:MAG: sugar phosphate isomerase/epimerase [Lachnospiraceae bacterium]|nr:sugar phosphate isomerase/epimerase [Clostridium sp.]MDY4821870.1 sugar phosphate isomerase/epimerase [Lachnospiraceae bacterium]